jgi:hypothetical protein
MVMLLDVALRGTAQPELEIISRETTPLFGIAELNVGLFVPEAVPFTYHWYIGADPPLIGVAVNVSN